ncbi:alpha-amylase family glycosyl hydrolase [Mucilaginibacter kameinonensis]|uniref:alpha-amylase family glycosyl hydrolase n=1 Tax=Mucilaginibacter kameinonensis TaxID=452286 RepID=UPI000EF7831A|nr:alpha-amylase family glycosyl hydrolase [Mucilaginibacter kameinonensis]
MKLNRQFILSSLLFGLIFTTINARPKAAANDEIIYHIFQRSFYDSNGDYHGDLNGIRQKLDYLQDLGVTSILLTPLYESAFYHNYFAADFEKIDPKYGTLTDYLKLIKELHRRGMKFYMDMETQYVTEDSRWWKEAFGNPKSPYSDYILWDDKDNQKPLTIVYNLTGLKDMMA